MYRIGRRDFFKQAGAAIGAATQIPHWSGLAEGEEQHARRAAGKIAFPRVFSGDQLKMLAFPLGGVGAGSLALGGRPPAVCFAQNAKPGREQRTVPAKRGPAQ